jgi:hypothetical protein
VIDRGTDAAPIVWYAADDVDITAELIKAYNAKSGVPAPEQNPAGASPTGPEKPLSGP